MSLKLLSSRTPFPIDYSSPHSSSSHHISRIYNSLTFIMPDMASLWCYAENNDMEQLGQKLMCTTLELEKLKAEAVEEMQRNKEYIRQLIELLKHAIQERDEARNQFQKLLNKTLPSETFPSIPLLKPTRANSSITESNSLSETHNLQSHASSPVDSFFDAVSSPEHNLVQSCISYTVPKLDKASLIIDNLAKGVILPQKGKFLQSVLQAGPLLQTLLVAGPLPRWRNPPQFQSSQIPPFSIKGCEAEVRKPVANFGQLSCGSAQVHSAPLLSFGTSLNANGYAPLNKRQRFC